MRACLIATAILVAIGCRSHHDEAPAAKPNEPPAKLDPEGPCVTVANGECKEHDPKFAAARRAATRVDIARGPADSGPLPPTSLYAIALTSAQAGNLCVHIEAPGPAASYTTRDWWSSRVGWTMYENGFTSAEPGARWDQQIPAPEPGEHLIAIESEPKSELRVKVGRCPLP